MFETVFGHQRIKDVLERMLKNDALHHGLCFYGPAGIGKRLMAQQLARTMLCETQTGCGTCKHCHKFDSHNHPDYQEISPDGADIKVDQIRQIAENLHFRPFEGRCRVIVLDQVERFREEAANAFLKSLEEPPDYVYFVLVCADLKALLPTIRSRCQKMAFQPLNEADKTNILVKRFGKPESMAQRLASISFRQLETDEEAWDHFLKDTRMVLTFYLKMFEDGHAMDYLADVLRDKSILPRFTDHLMATTRELTLVALGREPGLLFSDYREQVKELARRAPASSWRQTWEALTRLQGKRRLHLNLPLWFNAMSVVDLNLLEQEEARVKAHLARR